MAKAHASDEVDLSSIYSRIQVGVFVAVTGGLLVLTLTSTLGDQAIRSVMLGTLSLLFVAGGGLMGLVSMQHVSQTHLPDDSDEELTDLPLLSSQSASTPTTRGRGFKGLFSFSQEEPDQQSSTPGNYGRSR